MDEARAHGVAHDFLDADDVDLERADLLSSVADSISRSHLVDATYTNGLSPSFQQLSLHQRIGREERLVRSTNTSPRIQSNKFDSPHLLASLLDMPVNVYERRGLMSPSYNPSYSPSYPLVSPSSSSSSRMRVTDVSPRMMTSLDGDAWSADDQGLSNSNSNSSANTNINVVVLPSRSHPALQPWVVSILRAVVLVLLWYLFSMALSLYNKFLVGEKHGKFPAPLLMTTFHFLLQYFISIFCLRCVCPTWGTNIRISWNDYLFKVAPTAVATAVDIGLSNLSLAFITLTFYTMCKSSAPVFLLLFAFAFRLESPSLKLLGVMLVISAGVLLTVAGETEFQLLGFLLVMFASTTSGLRWVLIQVLLHRDKLGLTNPLVTLSYLTPLMALVCGVFAFFHEPWHTLHMTVYFDTWRHAIGSTMIMVVGGCLAFCMIMTEFLLILETSAVTFSVAGTVKEGATILVSHLIFGDKFTKVNIVGLFVIMLGVSLFNIYKYGRMKEGKGGSTPDDDEVFDEEEEPMLQADNMSLNDPPVIVTTPNMEQRSSLKPQSATGQKSLEMTSGKVGTLPSPGSQHLHERKFDKASLDKVEEGQEK